ncbi:sugar ABC transporter substrate-binding protein [Asanoa ishikariensis]|uniref:Carbohydrate ABC transporter substrate-binding protein, CUT1 family n=1 Tax=Asanoa ishikariensis TaxID=137265 RepID=A0A1H3TFE9_9ACTN|nr:sugar ABC transporter substrate-binding protein [Asanoa ishikariensis]GIF62530.1 sugar ABC transporter substrate-binding protein [Asanoa ishikariensis]SDZ48974.1 carbohydrate ABC transporter substrate-binding protein, CUT1 family [Asanoa ishikariensis]
MKRRWIAATALAAAVTLLTACSGQSDEASGEKVTLTYANWSEDQTPAMQQIADEFQKANPDITIKVQTLPWTEYWTTLQVGAAGGTAPDAFWMLADHFREYAKGGQLVDMSDTVKSNNIDLAKYPKAVSDSYTYDGKLFALPKDFDTNGIWYNKALFDAAGVKYPDDTWTWQDAQDAAKKLTDPAKGVFGIAAPIDAQGGFYNTMLQAGGSIINADGTASDFGSPAGVEGLKFWTDLQAAKASPTLEQLSDTEAVSMFENQKVAMYFSGAYWALKFHNNAALKGKIDVAPLPQGVKRATVTSGIGNAGYAGSKHPEQLKKFLAFLGGSKAAEIQAATGTVLPAYEGTQQPWLDSMPEYKLQVFIDAIAYSVPLPVAGNASEWQGLATQYLGPAWSGKKPVQEAATEYQAAVDQVLAKK